MEKESDVGMHVSRRAFAIGASAVALAFSRSAIRARSEYVALDDDELSVFKKSPNRFVGEKLALEGSLVNFTEAPANSTFDMPDARGSYESFCELRALIPSDTGRQVMVVLIVAEGPTDLRKYEGVGAAIVHGEAVGSYEDDGGKVYPVVAMHEIIASEAANEPESEPTERPRPTKVPASAPVPLGELAAWNGWQVRVLNAYPEERPDLPGLAYSIAITLGVTNVGEDLRNFGLPDMDLWVVSRQGWKGTYSLVESARLTVGLGEWGSGLSKGIEYQQSSVYWVNAFDWNRFPNGLDGWTLHIEDGRHEPVLELGF